MKQLIKKSLKKIWGLTAFVREPVRRKLRALVVHEVYEQHLVLTSLVREIVRLQDQVEILQQMIEDLGQARDAGPIASKADACSARSMAG